MFGLMKPVRSCGSCGDECKGLDTYKIHRQHYCGTCKVIGREYGHSARLSLNFDTVFMAELLSGMQGVEVTGEWSAAFQAINRCFTMPEKGEELPLALRYAAATNMVLADLKLADNWKDTLRRRYRFVRWWWGGAFARAAKQWQEWGVDVAFFESQSDMQAVLEAEKCEFGSVEEAIAHYSGPTRAMTGRIMEEAARVVLGSEEKGAALRDIGEQLGRLMYGLDAFEDLERDYMRGEFNALLGLVRIDTQAEEVVSSTDLEECRKYLLGLGEALGASLQGLGMAAELEESFVGRLRSNLAMRLYREREVPRSLTQRIAKRWGDARAQAADILCGGSGLGRQLRYHLLSVAIFILPQAAYQIPQESRGEALGYFAIFSAMLASVGLAKRIYSAPIEPKKAKRSLWQRWKAWRERKKQDPCLTACCEVCCQACADQMCQSCCNSCCSNGGCCDCTQWSKDDWKVLLWVLIIAIFVAAIVVAVVLFV